MTQLRQTQEDQPKALSEDLEIAPNPIEIAEGSLEEVATHYERAG